LLRSASPHRTFFATLAVGKRNSAMRGTTLWHLLFPAFERLF
jgi:hypothetical protein